MSTDSLEAIAGLIPIKFHLQKLTSRSQLCSTALLENHLIITLIDDPLNMHNKPSPLSINMLTECQKNTIKEHLINSNNKLFGVFPSFSPLNLEFNPGFRIVDIFPDQVSFNLANKAKSDKLCF